MRGGHSRIRDGARAQSQLGGRIMRISAGASSDRVDRGGDPARGASHPPQPPRSPHRLSGITGSGSCICCNRAPTRRSSGSKRRAAPIRDIPFTHACLASAYALKGETERAAAELAEARRLSGDDRYSSIARLKAVGYFGVQCRRSAPCSKPLISPACARPGCRRSEHSVFANFLISAPRSGFTSGLSH